MKKEIGKYIAIFLGIVCIILITVLIYIKSTNVSSDTASKNLKSKTLEEIRYLDSNIIEVMNRVNNITVINYKVFFYNCQEFFENFYFFVTFFLKYSFHACFIIF